MNHLSQRKSKRISPPRIMSLTVKRHITGSMLGNFWDQRHEPRHWCVWKRYPLPVIKHGWVRFIVDRWLSQLSTSLKFGDFSIFLIFLPRFSNDFPTIFPRFSRFSSGISHIWHRDLPDTRLPRRPAGAWSKTWKSEMNCDPRAAGRVTGDERPGWPTQHSSV